MAESEFERRTAKLYIKDLEKIRERTAETEESIAGYVHFLLEYHDRMSTSKMSRPRRILEEIEEDIRDLEKIRRILRGGDPDDTEKKYTNASGCGPPV